MKKNQKKPKDIGASVRARLLQIARDRGEDFQLVLTRFANERLLYRLTKSPYGPNFVLKGAALFALWTGKPHRATRDVDLLGYGDSSEEHIQSVFTEVIDQEVVEDGVQLDKDSLSVGPIREEQEYGGVQVVLFAYVSGAKVRLQIDVGFGDAVTPKAEVIDFPSMLDFPAPQLRVYPRESVVAEKLEAMVNLGLANSRMKDFYDVMALSQTFAFDGGLLVRAIQATFERRGTPLPVQTPVALSPEFTDDDAKNKQWSAFMRKSGASGTGSLSDVIAAIGLFVRAPMTAAKTSKPFLMQWQPGGPWE